MVMISESSRSVTISGCNVPGTRVCSKKFGQREKLTQRLKRILIGYPFDKEVLKELLQNADDAGCSRIVFIVDPRHHPSVKIGEETWDTLQGPSLCVYNDKPFTKADLEGIQSLGEGSKSEDPTKTGQYGVGFNAVYHFTDTPTFVSHGPEIGKVLCALDPHHRYIPGATADSPGCMFDNLAELEGVCPGLLKRYLVDSFPLKNSTTFRFPLRTQDQAKDSQISKNSVTVKMMEDLLMNLKKDMMECLLFLNNLKSIEVGRMETSGSYRKIFGAWSQLSAEEEEKRQGFIHAVKQSCLSFKQEERGIESLKRHTVIYVARLEDTEGMSEEWLVSEQFGFHNPRDVPDDVKEAYKKGNIGMLPRTGAAMMLNADGVERQKEQHRFYCFLPLPTQTNLPMHINGHFALDHESRRGLWQDDGGGYRTSWNNLLLENLITPAYVELMGIAKEMITGFNKTKDVVEKIEKYYKLFPSTAGFKDGYQSTLAIAIYRMIKDDTCLPVYFQKMGGYCNVEWYQPRQCCQDRLDIQCPNTSNDVLSRILHGCKFPLVSNLPLHISDGLECVGIILREVDPECLLQLLIAFKNTSTVLRDISFRLPMPVFNTPFESPDTLKVMFEYLLSQQTSPEQKGKVLSRLEGVPLLLTASGNITKFSCYNKAILSEFSDLAVGCDHQFLHPTLVKILPKFCDIQKHTNQLCDLTPGKLSELLSQSTLRSLQQKKTTSCQLADLKRLHPKGEEGATRWLNRIWNFLAKWAKTQRAYLPRRVTSQEAEKVVFQSVDALYDWYIVPVKTIASDYLLPLGMIYLAVKDHPGFPLKGFEQTITAALRRLGLPRPDDAVIKDSRAGRQLLLGWVTSTSKPDGVLLALYEHFTCAEVEKTSAQTLEHKEVDALMKYFSLHLESIKDMSCTVHVLRKLPGYRTAFDAKFVSLASRQAYVLPKNIPTKEMNVWEKESGAVVFLKDIDDMTDIHKLIGCTFPTVTEVYCPFVFDNFKHLSADVREEHLILIKDLVDESRSNSDYVKSVVPEGTSMLLNKLQDLSFIECSDGELRTAAECFDPSEQVFVQFKKPSELLPDRYSLCHWKPFLEQCGLKSMVSPDMFCDFARSLHGKQIDDNFQEGSRVLLHCLTSCTELQNASLLHRIRDIAFLVPYTVQADRLAIHPQFRQNVSATPVTFNGSVWQETDDLAWTNCDILPNTVQQSLKTALGDELCQELGVLTKPDVGKVVEHACNIFRQLASLSSEDLQQHSSALSEITSKLCRYLEKLDLPTNEQQKLKDLKFVLHMSHMSHGCDKILLVRPNQTVWSSMWGPMYPYLVECPASFRRHKTFMEMLGMQFTPSPQQLAVVLEEIYSTAKGDTLESTERTAAERAQWTLLRLLSEGKKQFDGSQLYLLSENGTMHAARDILINDNEGIYERMAVAGNQNNESPLLLRKGNYMRQLSDFEVIKALRKLPTEVQPVLLTDLVSERLDEDQTIKSECSLDFAEELTDRFSHEAFVDGIYRLMKFASLEHSTDIAKELKFEDIKAKLADIQVFSAEKLVTHLIFKKSKEIDQSSRQVDGSSRQVDYVIGNEESKKFVIHVTRQVDLDMFYGDLARRIGPYLDSVLQHECVSHLTSILRCKVESVAAILDKAKIPRTSVRESSRYTHEIGEPGKYVPIKLHHLLVQDIQNFMKGDIVVTEMHDLLNTDEPVPGTYIFAKIVEKEKTEDGGDDVFRARYAVRCRGYKRVVCPTASLYRLDWFHKQSPVEDLPSLSAIKDQLQVGLEEANKLPVAERDRITKRLILKWLADERPGMQEIRNEILEIITNNETKGIQEVEDSVLPSSPSSLHHDSQDVEVPQRGNSQWRKCENRIAYLTKRAKEYQSANKAHMEDMSRSTKYQEGVSYFSKFNSTPNPQPGEWRWWLLKAAHDLASAKDTVKEDRESPDWNCYKSYQVGILAYTLPRTFAAIKKQKLLHL